MRGSWRPQKKMVGTRPTSWGSTSKRSSSTPLNTSSYCPPRCGWTRTWASSDTAHPRRCGRAPSERTGATGSGRSPGGVEGADHRRRVQQQGGHGGPGGHRLVQVEHVEVLVAQGPDGAQRRRGVGGQRRHRAVGRGRDAVAERRDERVGRRAVAGSHHPDLVAPAAQRPGQPEDLPLHTAGHGQAVRADQTDAHPASGFGVQVTRATVAARPSRHVGSRPRANPACRFLRAICSSMSGASSLQPGQPGLHHGPAASGAAPCAGGVERGRGSRPRPGRPRRRPRPAAPPPPA